MRRQFKHSQSFLLCIAAAVAGDAPPTGLSKGSTEEGEEKCVQEGPAKGDEVKSRGAGGEKERLLEDDPFVEVRKAIKKIWAIPLSGLVNTVLLGMVVGKGTGIFI